MNDSSAEPGGGTGRYSVPQAARYLGISERAVRKRITAGTLRAEKDGPHWSVFLSAVPGAHVGGTVAEPGAVPPEPDIIEARYRVTPAEIEQAVERTGERYIADIASMFDRVDGLYRAQLDAKDETIAELRRRAEAAESRLSELEEQQAESLDEPTSMPETRPQRAWWRFWERET